MFCIKCGNRLAENDNFCSKCGKELNELNYSKNEFSNFTVDEGVLYSKNVDLDCTKYNYLEIIKTFFIGMMFVALGSFVGINFIPYSIVRMINILFVVFVIVSALFLKSEIIKDKTSMNVYCFILGIILGITLLFYLNSVGSSTFISCVLGIGVIFAISYIYALKSDEEDIFKMGPVLYKAILGLVIFEIINIFLFGFGTLDLMLSVGGIAIYSAYVLYTMKGIQVRCSQGILSEKEVVVIAISLITSFLNLLLDLLRLIYIIKRND